MKIKQQLKSLNKKSGVSVNLCAICASVVKLCF
jgi:sulfur relay (sulfurtransferase) complex TusBCD TusD component (DsrE family)